MVISKIHQTLNLSYVFMTDRMMQKKLYRYDFFVLRMN